MAYIHALAVKGGAILRAAWGTTTLVPSARIGAMVNVRVPTVNRTKALALIPQLMDQYGVWVPVYPWPNDGHPNEEVGGGEVGGDEARGGDDDDVVVHYYMRVCAQIYNDESDFEMLADAVLRLLNG